jgi:hypothetical protein
MVIRQFRSVTEHDPVVVRQEFRDRSVDVFHTLRDELALRLDDIRRLVRAERDEQEARLVVVGFVLIDDGDAKVVSQAFPQLVGCHRAGCASSEDQYLLHFCCLSIRILCSEIVSL